MFFTHMICILRFEGRWHEENDEIEADDVWHESWESEHRKENDWISEWNYYCNRFYFWIILHESLCFITNLRSIREVLTMCGSFGSSFVTFVSIVSFGISISFTFSSTDTVVIVEDIDPSDKEKIGGFFSSFIDCASELSILSIICLRVPILKSTLEYKDEYCSSKERYGGKCERTINNGRCHTDCKWSM